jgi:hypothetical protein
MLTLIDSREEATKTALLAKAIVIAKFNSVILGTSMMYEVLLKRCAHCPTISKVRKSRRGTIKLTRQDIAK